MCLNIWRREAFSVNRRDWKYIWYVLRDFSKRYKAVLVSTLFWGIVEALKPYIAVIMTGYLLDGVYEGKPAKTLVLYALAGVGAVFVIAVINSILIEYTNTKFEYMMEIQNQYLNEKGMSMDYDYLESMHVHDMRQRVEKCCGDFSLLGAIYSTMRDWLVAGFSMLFAVIIVLPMFLHSNRTGGVIGSWYMSALFFIILGVIIWINFKAGVFYNERIRVAWDKFSPFENRRKFYMDIFTGYEGQKDLRIYREQPIYEKEAEVIANGEKQVQDEVTRDQIRHGVVGQALSAVTGLMVYLFAGLQAYVGLISIGSVVAYAASILKFTTAVNQFTELSSDLKSYAKYAADYAEYMELEKKHKEGKKIVEKRKDGHFTVEFEHVYFRYPGTERYVIHDLNLQFEVGEKMAIVGKNGSGKTTFIKLLCRLYDVTEGCIRVNGTDIREYDEEDYSRLFSVVFQDFRIFSFPLGENIAASASVDSGRANDALARAGLKERMERLPNGLATCVGKEFEESGVSFSGGEKQKMAIARAIYKDAPFILMDEPTAALDPLSECEVYEGFDRMVGKKTAIYISHRLASCRFCEDILVFDNGSVVQKGNHDKLEKEEGLYRELWNAQAQYYA